MDIVDSVLVGDDATVLALRRQFLAHDAYQNGLLTGAGIDPATLSPDDLGYVLGDDDIKNPDLRLDACRHCAAEFRYTYKGWTTTVIAGMPKPGEKYHAVSYVWGQTTNHELHCTSCGLVTIMPVASPEKFRRLMRCITIPGEPLRLWLDALSINQSDEKEKAKLLGVMGDIYTNAWSVVVVLPQTDERAYRVLATLAHAATILNVSPLATENPNTLKEDPQLTLACRVFNALMDEMARGLPSWAYWRRAWTFQEWALAPHISLGLDGAYFAGNVIGIKNTILQAATLIAAYKLLQHQYSVIDFGYSRGEVVPRFNTVKRLFPDKRAFYPPDLMTEEEANIAIVTATFNISQALCLRSAVPTPLGGMPLKQMFDLTPDVGPSTLLEKLCFAWHALGVSKREARFEADLVSSWASMCNIKYAYNPNDSFAAALQKVLSVLRRQTTIYAFHISTSALGVDSAFLEYASPHRQCNATNASFLHGLPVLTGRADTLTYFRHCMQPATTVEVAPAAVKYRRVVGAQLLASASLADSTAALSAFSVALVGHNQDGPSGAMYTDVRVHLLSLLQTTSSDKQFVVMSLPTGTGIMAIWAIVPRGSSPDTVMREALNGTLVVAAGDTPLAYLTISDNLSGTYLLRVGGDGKINIDMRRSQRGDMMSSSLPHVQTLVAQVTLERREGVFGEAAPSSCHCF